MSPPGSGDEAPLVSIVVLNYNYARFARECLDSVKAQTYAPIELIVVDDGSSDDSREVLRAWIDEHWPHAVTDLSETNLGLLARASQALELARGRYYQIFSTDDRMVPTKIARQVEVLEQNPDAALCYSDMRVVDELGAPTGELALDVARAAGQPPRSGWVLDRVLTRAGFCAPSWLLRRDAVRAVGGYETRIYTEDTPLLVRLAARYQFEYVEEPLVEYRWHGANLSTRFESTPDHRIAWCELLRSIDVPPYAVAEWRAAYRTRVRMLMIGNSRAEILPFVRHLARTDPSLPSYGLLVATELGICDGRLRWLLARRDALRQRVRRHG